MFFRLREIRIRYETHQTAGIKKELLSGKKQFITASAADRPAEEYAPGRQGAFSYFFLQGMMGPADSNKNGWVDTIEAFSTQSQS